MAAIAVHARLLLCASLVSLTAALRLDVPLTRRSAVALPALLVSAPAIAAKEPYSCRGTAEGCVGQSDVARLLATPGQGESAGIRFAGTYSDPAFPGLPRKLQLAGTNVIINGKDEKDGKEWKVKGKPYGRALVLDFSSKGGEKDVIARWTGLGLSFPDGSVWTKK